jgi:hypothetical protein
MASAKRILVTAFDARRQAVRMSRHLVRSTRVLLFCVCLAFAAAGCGNSSTPKTPVAAADGQDNADEPAEKAPPKVEKKPDAKPAPAPVVQRRPNDPLKWEPVDLQSGLAARDGRFAAAVLGFSMQNPNGAESAEKLRALLERAGKLPDDRSISLPLPPAPVAAPVTAAKPVTPAPAATQAATPPAKAAAPGGRRSKRAGRYGGMSSE